MGFDITSDVITQGKKTLRVADRSPRDIGQLKGIPSTTWRYTDQNLSGGTGSAASVHIYEPGDGHLYFEVSKVTMVGGHPASTQHVTFRLARPRPAAPTPPAPVNPGVPETPGLPVVPPAR